MQSRTVVRILFVHNGRTPFVQLDLDQLRKAYSVTEFYLRSRWVNPASVWRHVKNHDLVFGWFASWHTFLPMVFAKLLGKPSVLIIGGYDVAKLSEIRYGHQRGGPKKWLSRWTMRSATRVLAISSFSSNEAQRNAAIPKERMRILDLGVPDSFEKLTQSPRARLILTVGNVDLPNLRRKGLEPFVQTAALMPDADFVLVGAWKDEAAIECLRSIATPNVFFAGRVDDQRLLDYYRKASVYVQPSLHEGFGLSVAEAMLAGCAPVVTRAGALPEVVGPCGEYVDSTEPHKIAQAIQTALTYSESARARIRQRILDEFPMAKRGRAVEQILTELTARRLPTVDAESQPATEAVGKRALPPHTGV